MNKNNEEELKNNSSLLAELKSYGNYTSLLTVNRDGDKYFIECPSCHSTELNSMRLVSCKNCHTHFDLYYEDGFKEQQVITDFSSVSNDEKIKLVGLEGKDSYFKTILHPRNYSRIDALIKKHPNVEIVTFNKDLQNNGKDAHSHRKYKRYALIPLD